MTDARKLNPKPGQHLGKRVRRPKKTPKGHRPIRPRKSRWASRREYKDMPAWEKELLGLDPFNY